jgi:Uma2 family endonuclease
MSVQSAQVVSMRLTAQQLDDLMPDASQLLSDEPEMESSLHYQQLLMLVTALEWLWRDRDDFFIGANLTIYYSRLQLKNRDFRGPDLFLVKQTSRQPRTSWVIWEEEGRYPNLIIELLSDSTAAVDRGLKKQLYQDLFHTYEYFWFSPDTLEFQGFKLIDRQYQPIPANEQGWRWSEELGLYLGILVGRLRYFTATGILVPTPEEAATLAIQEAEQESQRAEQESQRAEQESQRAEQESQRAEQESQRAEQESRRAESLAQRLRDLGIDPDAE